MKKFRTIAGQGLCATYPEPHTTCRWRLPGEHTQTIRFGLSRTNPRRRICLGHISHGCFARLRKHPPNAPTCRIGLSGGIGQPKQPLQTTAPAGRSHATTPPANTLRATADLGLVFLFFIRESYEEIPDESGPKTPQLVLPFFVEPPNEEIPDDRRSGVVRNLSGTAHDPPRPAPPPSLTTHPDQPNTPAPEPRTPTHRRPYSSSSKEARSRTCSI
ncbi:hypothetical protein CCANI_01685 [Corynebacterium canis]|nr:hypothetical protein CCANI_01685 [Corynebacterium canis]